MPFLMISYAQQKQAHLLSQMQSGRGQGRYQYIAFLQDSPLLTFQDGTPGFFPLHINVVLWRGMRGRKSSMDYVQSKRCYGSNYVWWGFSDGQDQNFGNKLAESSHTFNY